LDDVCSLGQAPGRPVKPTRAHTTPCPNDDKFIPNIDTVYESKDADKRQHGQALRRPPVGIFAGQLCGRRCSIPGKTAAAATVQ